MKQHLQSKSGFTLIELLAVIAVVAILSSILMAAISGARRMAHTTECTSNLRNLGISLKLYSQHNNGRLPTPGNYNTVPNVGTGLSWMYALNEFLETRFPNMNERSMLLCPSAAETYPGGDARRTYGMNAAGTGGDLAINPITFIKPASTVLLMDTKHNGGGDGYFAFGAGSFEQYAGWRHDNGVNVLFVDGHVERIEHSDLPRLEEFVLNYQQRD